MHFRNALIEVYDALSVARADTKITLVEGMRLTAGCLHAVELVLNGLTGDAEEYNALVVDMEWLVTQYIVPLDLPIPDGIEKYFIDPQLPGAVRPFLDMLRAKLVDGDA